MTDIYSIDNHKLHLHPKQVAYWKHYQETKDWNIAKQIYPIYIEMSPLGFCNHRCTFCAVDYLEYPNKRLDFEKTKKAITDMAAGGTKSIMFAGEGEPTLYKDLPKLVEHAYISGIDTSLTTNGSGLTDENMHAYLQYCSWIKVSFNGGNRETYEKIHRKKDFDLVFKNIQKAAQLKSENNYKCVLGTQMVLVRDNENSVYDFVRNSKAMGVEYCVIKPYSQHMDSKTTQYKDMNYEEFMKIVPDLMKFEDENFKVVPRIQTMKNWDNQNTGRYKTCSATPFFWAYVECDGTVVACSCHLINDKFRLGNIHEQSFKEIWEGDKRKKLIHYVENELNVHKQCRVNCRPDAMNRYLDRIRNPEISDNFI
jgi:radical SAM protein with 4Fe4S-binding SPASM domain